jgi:hypothetical protein
MPTQGTPRKSYRLRPATLAKIEEIAELQGGLDHTRVIELAIAELHYQLLIQRKPLRPRPD